MTHQPFFNPSPLYKEFMLLDVIDKETSITQRRMSSFIHSSVSMINEYLRQYEKDGYVKRIYHSPKVVTYQLSLKGKERLKLLNVWFLSASQKVYLDARSNITDFFNRFIQDTPIDLLIYGAGEFAQIIVDMIEISYPYQISIKCIVDDDTFKVGQSFKTYAIESSQAILQYQYDYIFIASYHHRTEIIQKLSQLGISESKIIDYFTGINDEG